MSYPLIQVQNLTHSFGTTTLFEKLSFSLHAREKVALIGPNGSGKSTFLKRLVEGCKGTLFQHLPQESVFMHASLQEEIDAHLLSYESLEKALEKALGVAYEQETMQRLIESINFLEQRLSRFETFYKELLGFEIELQLPLSSLSLGQKRRLALAFCLVQETPLLMLDEPTNHLDQKALEWLESYLKSYSGGALFTSHDRMFIDKVATRIIEFAPAKDRFIEYGAGWDMYCQKKKEDLAKRAKEFERTQGRLSSLKRELIQSHHNSKKPSKPTDSFTMAYDRHGELFQKGKTTKIKKLKEEIEELESTPLENPIPKDRLPFRFRPISLEEEVVLTLHDVHTRTKALSLTCKRNDRLVLLGENGSGKSTFLQKLFTNQKGEQINWSSSARLGYLPQNSSLDNENNTPVEWLQEQVQIPFDMNKELHRAGILPLRDTPCRILSQGQKRRVEILALELSQVNVLLLDEPTNHLDLDMVEQLEKALFHFEGLVIAASHDRKFIDRFGVDNSINLSN